MEMLLERGNDFNHTQTCAHAHLKGSHTREKMFIEILCDFKTTVPKEFFLFGFFELIFFSLCDNEYLFGKFSPLIKVEASSFMRGPDANEIFYKEKVLPWALQAMSDIGLGGGGSPPQKLMKNSRSQMVHI